MRAALLLAVAQVLLGVQPTGSLNSVWTEKCSGEHCEQQPAHNQCTKYLLYDVNKGEGFNLKRDIYVRIAPIVVKLNRLDKACKWILVLHPWGGLPHWETHGWYPWSTFFDSYAMEAYVPILELEDFLDVLDSLKKSKDFRSSFYQLQHFPLNSQISDDWRKNVANTTACESSARFRRTSSSESEFRVTAFSQPWTFQEASCLAVKGDSSDMVQFLMHENATFVFLDRAEVILWDRYGDHTWWEARKSLKFSKRLIDIAYSWMQTSISTEFNSTSLYRNNYLAVHVRRKDFVANRKNAVSLEDVACNVASALRKLPGIQNIFIATDGSRTEHKQLRNLISTFHKTALSTDDLEFHSFYCDLTEGECAIIDQIICSWAKQFIGTKDSTFTLRIFEEREIKNIDPDYNYNVFCSGCSDSGGLQVYECQKTTRWPIQ